MGNTVSQPLQLEPGGLTVLIYWVPIWSQLGATLCHGKPDLQPDLHEYWSYFCSGPDSDSDDANFAFRTTDPAGAFLPLVVSYSRSTKTPGTQSDDDTPARIGQTSPSRAELIPGGQLHLDRQRPH